jgi:hypothetical protein
MKPAHPTQEEKEKITVEIGHHIFRGDYKSALPIAKAARKIYPNDVFCRYQYAKILGDWADELPAARRKKLKQEAIGILKPLLRALGGESPEIRFGICLNYYYQAEDFLGMVRFGKKLAARHDRQGYYAVGLGAGHEAMRLHLQRNSRCRNWARKSITAWRRYDLAKEKYYFPHYIEAMAYGVLGNKPAGLKSLGRAAKASQRSVDDSEFADVRSLLIDSVGNHS